MKPFLPFAMAASALLLNSCGPKIYMDPNAASIVQNHQSIAILPPKVSIAPQKKVDAAALLEQQKAESVNFQKETHSWLLKRKAQEKIGITIQDVETTNALLNRAGFSNDYTTLTPGEIADILGVDAVMSSSYSLAKPMSQGAAIALALLVGFYGSTNSATVNLSLYDKLNNKMFWKYNHKAEGSMLSSPAMLINSLMKNASKKMPYSIKQ